MSRRSIFACSLALSLTGGAVGAAACGGGTARSGFANDAGGGAAAVLEDEDERDGAAAVPEDDAECDRVIEDESCLAFADEQPDMTSPVASRSPMATSSSAARGDLGETPTRALKRMRPRNRAVIGEATPVE